jgi:AcrR family transcriptional regulator
MAQRGPYSKTAATRGQILSAALEIISLDGYSGATLQQVADAVGMSKPGVLHHFGSRDGLFTAILARRDEINTTTGGADDDLVTTFLDSARRNTGVPGLVALFTALAAVAATDPGAVESREFFATRYPRLVDSLTDAIRSRQESGEVTSTADPRALAGLLVAASDGLQTRWLLDPSVDLVGELDLLWTLIATGR